MDLNNKYSNIVPTTDFVVVDGSHFMFHHLH